MSATQLLRVAIIVVPHCQIAASIVVFDRRVFAARRHGLVVKLEPTALRIWPHESVVVPAVDIAVVDNHRIEAVLSFPRSEAGKIQLPREFEACVQLHHVHLFQVKVEALQLEVEHRRESQEADAFLGALLAVALGLVGVVALQRLLICEFPNGFRNVLQLLPPLALDVELDVVEGLSATRRVIDIEALNVVLHFSFEETLYGSI
mmetsp:Transcript_5159/g.8346  ORF Transcript_5159/g.8346 Transcript_5159/m.8346 type:complete len:205 (-) Transcript_5159:1008-1622(-)